MKFEWKMRKLRVLVKINLMMNLRWIGVIIRGLLLFWMPFDVYKLMYKFWGQIWGQGDQNWGFWMKIEEPKIWVPLSCQTHYSEWLHAILSCSLQQLMVLAFWVHQGRSGPFKLILLMYLNTFILSKPLEISNELDWTWFYGIELNLFENGSWTRIFRKLFFSK